MCKKERKKNDVMSNIVQHPSVDQFLCSKELGLESGLTTWVKEQ